MDGDGVGAVLKLAALRDPAPYRDCKGTLDVLLRILWKYCKKPQRHPDDGGCAAWPSWFKV